MSGENLNQNNNENFNQNNNQKMLSDAEVQRRRNVANNANNVRLAADVASNTANPYAKAAGIAVKAADKISGGKASEKLGKALNSYMKTQGLKGKMMQAAMNKMSESGTSNRIAAAANKKNNMPTNPSTPKGGTLSGNNIEDSSSKMKETTEQTDGGSASFNFSSKVVKYGLIFSIASFFIILPICLFMTASNIYIKSIGLGNADSVSFEDAESKINKKQKDTESIEEGVTDDDLSFDIFIEDEQNSFRKTKLNNSNLVKIAQTTYLRRKYNEADLANLEDFYPTVVSLGKNYDENMVYDFFFKMYNLYTTYRDTYNVHLDLPLLMSTLMIQSDDMNVIFSSNLSKEDRAKTARKKPIKEFDYYYDWSGHILDSDSSTNDMEILAQRMVSYQVKETCTDSSGKITQEKLLRDNETKNQVLFCAEGETYKKEDLGMQIDNEKYKDFLKEFLEKKYYIQDEKGLSSNPVDGLVISTNNSSVEGSNSFADEMINVANKEYKLTNGEKYGMKYINAFGNSAFGKGTPWCAIFAWYITANTKYNGQSLYPDIIPFKTAAVREYIKGFNSSSKENIKFYYNDSCKNLKGKNGDLNYKPKKGDFIFYDWQAQYYDISSDTQDHVAIVEKYENGTIYTIEGNYGNTVSKAKFSINDCRVIGFGSWY